MFDEKLIPDGFAHGYQKKMPCSFMFTIFTGENDDHQSLTFWALANGYPEIYVADQRRHLK